MPIKTILVALTLADDSKQIADRAVQLANQHGARLVGLHVIENLSLDDAALPPSVDADSLAALIETQCTQQLKALLAASDTPAVIHVEFGKPYEAIQVLATFHNADLLVMGPGVAKSLREKVFGSTADRMVRTSPCPVLVVRTEPLSPYAHIVIGVDFSEHAQAAAWSAERISPAALREFIHTVEIPLSFEQAMLKAGATQIEIDHYRSARVKAARMQIKQLFANDGRLPKSARIKVVHGDPASVLLGASRRRGTDLVALGTQGAHAAAQHLLGSVARKVLASSNCDVLVVPATAIPETQ